MRVTPLFPLVLFLAVAACGSSDGAENSGGSTVNKPNESSGGAGGSGGTGGDATGTGGAGASSTGGGGSGSGGVPGALCGPIPACDAAPPPPGAKVDWNGFLPPFGDPQHRGRDMFYNPGDTQWLMAKFAYGALDDDLTGEFVDVYLNRECSGAWEYLGKATTTQDGDHATVEGVEDTGGRVYFEIPADKQLGLGRHRVHMVVKGDLTTADFFIKVVPKGAPLFVSDIDGTLTTYETEEFVALAQGALPDVRPDAVKLFDILTTKGYHPFYMTARPEWLDLRTREFLKFYAFPAGIMHTTLSKSGALGGEAETYKTNELALIATKGLLPTFAFGNTASDAAAYFNAGVGPDDHRVFMQFDDTVHNGRRIDAYTELLTEAEALPSLCP